jgi:RNA polymerase sigma-70 factor (sigma-E family)
MDSPDASVAEASRLAEIFTQQRRGLLRIAVLLVGDRPTAEDVVQEAFLGLQRRWQGLKDPASAVPYARRSVINGCHSVLRRRAVAGRFRHPHEPATWSAESAALLSEERREVLRALERLPPRRREVIVLRFYLDLTDAEIAYTMGISEATVRSTAARALRALGQTLGETP